MVTDRAATVSVVVPCYNRADLVGQTLRSLLNQTLPADEIIVVDDGSSDGTQEAAWAAFHRWERDEVKRERWEGGKVPEFKVIRQENAGPGAARNRGFAESKGEFIHFFDSDDIAAPNKHQVQVKTLQETRADIAVGPWVKGRIKEQGARSKERGVESGEARGKRFSFEPEGHVLQQKGLPKGNLIKELLTRWSLVPHACMFRREIVEKAEGFPEQYHAGEDLILFLKCFLGGARVVHSAGTIELYRLGNAKLSDTAFVNSRFHKDWAAVLVEMRELCLAANIDPARWFGFCARCWDARRNLRCVAGAMPQLAEQLKSASATYPWPLYWIHQRIVRYRGAVQQRLTGGREGRTFRSGPLTEDQLSLIREAGYTLT